MVILGGKEKLSWDYDNICPQGWVCPKCGRVYSPTTIMCLCCGGNEATVHTTMTIGTANTKSGISLDDILGRNKTGVDGLPDGRGEQDDR